LKQIFWDFYHPFSRFPFQSFVPNPGTKGFPLQSGLSDWLGFLFIMAFVPQSLRSAKSLTLWLCFADFVRIVNNGTDLLLQKR
jgi:hypothetical protein